jgi:hypothetical protein
MSTKKAY